MKTTIDIADALLDEAKRIADRDGLTINDLVELGLRRLITEENEARARFRLRRASFAGDGLAPDLRDARWDQIRALACAEQER